MYTLNEINQLCEESRNLSSKLNRMFLSVAIPMAQKGELAGTFDTDRLHRISEKAQSRHARRRDIQADIRWPARIEQRKKLK